jgi:mono/diheme cytochrome c family protein
MLTMALSGTMPLNASPARPRPRGEIPQVPVVADLERGRALFAANCAGCHGTSGAGDGPGAGALRPYPANLTEHSYTRARVIDALWNGVAGTSMQAWRDYPLADLAALADYVRSLDTTTDRDPVAAEQVAPGADVYASNCVQCHGAAGDGRGPAVGELRIAPTDFRAQRPSLATAVRALETGVAGTQMAPWTDRLSDERRVAVAHYVRSLFQGDGGGR